MCGCAAWYADLTSCLAAANHVVLALLYLLTVMACMQMPHSRLFLRPQSDTTIIGTIAFALAES